MKTGQLAAIKIMEVTEVSGCHGSQPVVLVFVTSVCVCGWVGGWVLESERKRE